VSTGGLICPHDGKTKATPKRGSSLSRILFKAAFGGNAIGPFQPPAHQQFVGPLLRLRLFFFAKGIKALQHAHDLR
jgi:hypothetical protein